jgi:hypothetical protein
MAKFNVGDRVKVVDKPGRPTGFNKLANWQGDIVEVMEDPEGYVLMKTQKTRYKMTFHENELEKI